MFCLLFYGHNSACAQEWTLDMVSNRHQISTRSKQGDRLILFYEGKDTRITIHTGARQQPVIGKHILQFWFEDDGYITEQDLLPLGDHTYEIRLTPSQKDDLIGQMTKRLDLTVRYPITNQTYQQFNFPLSGFTFALNDLLIAREIGRLDPAWLSENNKNNELMCYYITNMSVLAIIHRKQGQSATQVARQLKMTYSEAASELINDIVAQVYSMQQKMLPGEPRGDKFGIFKRCMKDIVK